MTPITWAVVFAIVGGVCRLSQIAPRYKDGSLADVIRKHPVDLGLATLFMAGVGFYLTNR